MNPITRRRLLGLFSFLPFLANCRKEPDVIVTPEPEKPKLPLWDEQPVKTPQPPLAPPRIKITHLRDDLNCFVIVVQAFELRLKSPFKMRWLHRLWGCDHGDHKYENVKLVDFEPRMIEWPMTLFDAVYNWQEGDKLLWPVLTEAYCLDVRNEPVVRGFLHLDDACEFTSRERLLWLSWITLLHTTNIAFRRTCDKSADCRQRLAELEPALVRARLELHA